MTEPTEPGEQLPRSEPNATEPEETDSSSLPNDAQPGDVVLAPTARLPVPASSPTSTAAAVDARPVPALLGRRQFARTTAVVVDRGRASFGLPSLGDRRQLGQIGLVVLMVAALGAILLARGGQPGTPGLGSSGSPSPHASLASPRPTAPATPAPSISPGPNASTPASSPVPSPTNKPQTYKVKSGDTLSSIAAKFHTPAKIIEQINDIKSPFVIHPGEILKLP
jgi:LysM repeat protein